MGVAKSHGGFAKEDGEIFMHAVADESCVIDGEEMGPAVQRIHVKASPSTRPKKPEPGGEVKMRIYDMSWASAVSPLNAVHVGVEVYNAEFSYGYAGLRCFTPGSYAAYKIRDTIALGRTNMTASQVTTMLQRLRREWLAEDYRLLGRNCQTFAVSFCIDLGIAAEKLPAEYLRFAGPLQLPSPSSIADAFLPVAFGETMPLNLDSCSTVCYARVPSVRVPPAPPQQEGVPELSPPSMTRKPCAALPIRQSEAPEQVPPDDFADPGVVRLPVPPPTRIKISWTAIESPRRT